MEVAEIVAEADRVMLELLILRETKLNIIKEVCWTSKKHLLNKLEQS